MYIIRIIIFFCVICLLFSAYDAREKEDSFSQIRSAYAHQDWVMAERLLVRYLRNEIDLGKSWQAWLLLLEVSEKANAPHDVILSYLKDMLQDYEVDPERKKFILAKIATTTDKKKDVESAIIAWDNYANLSNVLPSESFQIYRRLIQLNFLKGDFDAVEGVLNECTALDIVATDKAYCLYNLADLKAGKEQWDVAAELIQLVLVMKISDYDKAQAAFLYGDVLEQQREYKTALSYFEIALEHYGNKDVVQSRIDSLKKRLKIK